MFSVLNGNHDVAQTQIDIRYFMNNVLNAFTVDLFRAAHPPVIILAI